MQNLSNKGAQIIFKDNTLVTLMRLHIQTRVSGDHFPSRTLLPQLDIV